MKLVIKPVLLASCMGILLLLVTTACPLLFGHSVEDQHLYINMQYKEVAEVLGAPEVIETSNKLCQRWIYEKIRQKQPLAVTTVSFEDIIEYFDLVVEFDERTQVKDFFYRPHKPHADA
jgi:hypothetical protein